MSEKKTPVTPISFSIPLSIWMVTEGFRDHPNSLDHGERPFMTILESGWSLKVSTPSNCILYIFTLHLDGDEKSFVTILFSN